MSTPTSSTANGGRGNDGGEPVERDRAANTPAASDKTVCMDALRNRIPMLWINPRRKPIEEARSRLPFGPRDIQMAQARWVRFAPLLEQLFPELASRHGVIESELVRADQLAERIFPEGTGRLFVKADHALPVAGSIKARGGLYAVLHFAEMVALQEGLLLRTSDDYRKLAGTEARALFSAYELSVGSTGNLGLSIGIAGAALGFKVTVHMSVEAKEWKKERLRARGVRVIEHDCDYTAACVVARREAEGDPRRHFIDDENSIELFLGYACAIPHLRRQLADAGIAIDGRHPLFLYLPCGVGGAPGGLTFAARLEFGDDAHAFFVEPIEAPCMALGLLTGRHADSSVYELGLKLHTDADGLAVSTPSRFIGRIMDPLLDGCATLEDRTLYRHLLDLHETAGMEVEPSAAAGCAVPRMLVDLPSGRDYLQRTGLAESWQHAVHVIWTTGGLFVPPGQHEKFRAAAHAIR